MVECWFISNEGSCIVCVAVASIGLHHITCLPSSENSCIIPASKIRRMTDHGINQFSPGPCAYTSTDTQSAFHKHLGWQGWQHDTSNVTLWVLDVSCWVVFIPIKPQKTMKPLKPVGFNNNLRDSNPHGPWDHGTLGRPTPPPLVQHPKPVMHVMNPRDLVPTGRTSRSRVLRVSLVFWERRSLNPKNQVDSGWTMIFPYPKITGTSRGFMKLVFWGVNVWAIVVGGDVHV